MRTFSVGQTADRDNVMSFIWSNYSNSARLIPFYLMWISGGCVPRQDWSW